MTTTVNFKDYLDLPAWRPEAPFLATPVTGASMCGDMRNNAYRHPYFYLLSAVSAFSVFDPIKGDWFQLTSPGLTPSFGAGAWAVFHPSQGPRGTLAAGATATKVTLTTALPATVAPNQLANRGDGVGFRIRIVGAASGKTEEKYIIANTGGTTPAITLDSALTFTPATGDIYEIQSGRVFMGCVGTQAVGSVKYFDVATTSYSAGLSITNLPGITTDTSALVFSEAHVPSDRIPGDGFLNGGTTYNAGINNAILATAASSTTITGSGMPADLVANEYTNFQVRIVEDTTTPTAAGQRRRIASHTSGATGVFTVAAFGVTPSSSAKFVIENDDDKLIIKTSTGASTYTYNITANAWDTTTFATSVTTAGAGNILMQPFGVPRDPTNNFRHSQLLWWPGAFSSSLAQFDIANGANGTWTLAIPYANTSNLFTPGTGTAACYDGATLGGKYWHMNLGTGHMFRIDVKNRVLEGGTYQRFPNGTAICGTRMAMGLFVDGTTKLGLIYQLPNSQPNMFSLVVPR